MKESKIREILISYQKKRDKAESDLELTEKRCLFTNSGV